MVAHTKVFVGNLPQGSTPEQLRQLFEPFGVVTECTVLNQWGFIYMQTEEQAAAAIRDLNQSTFNGATILVEKGKIKEKKEVGPRRGGHGGPGGARIGPGSGRGGPGGGRSGPGGGRGGPRGGMRGSFRHRNMRGGHLRGRGRRGGSMRGLPMSRGSYNPRQYPYGIPDSRGFTLVEPPIVYPASPTYSDDRPRHGSNGMVNNHYPNFYNNRVAQPRTLSTIRAETAMLVPQAAPGEYPFAQFPPGPSGSGGSARH